MKQDFIEYLELCVREKKLSHAFLVETNNQEELLNKIYNLLKHENLVANLKIENNTDIAVIEPENNIIDKDKILNIQNKFLTMSFNNTLKVYFIKSAEKMKLYKISKQKIIKRVIKHPSYYKYKIDFNNSPLLHF